MSNSPNPHEGNYSFLLHNDSLLSSSSAPLDNADLPKQKRRRTSPRDHAVLEAAYNKNSKPDKHERAEIVSQVELGEKEVQIWFQNRRQNDRRKSKPLQPHELLAHFRNGTPLQSPIQSMQPDSEVKGGIPQPPDSHLSLNSDTVRPCSRSSSIHELLNPPPNRPRLQEGSHSKFVATGPLPTPPSSFEHSDVPHVPVAYDKLDQAPATINLGKDKLHSRKRSHEDMLRQTSEKEISSVKNAPPLPPPKPLTRSSSFVRLAMTVDGAVKVRTNDEPTPSPPKQRTLPPIDAARKRESFGRSKSAIETGFDFKDINPMIRKVGGAGFGRSRDTRTWEFYCDRDSGDALSTQAEAERSGSAVGAINLIRSRSYRTKTQALSPNPLKQNTHRGFKDQREGKPKLARATSSMARLQALDDPSEKLDKTEKVPEHVRSPSGDSDKENWAPGTRTSHHAMRRMHPTASRDTILQENDPTAVREPVETGAEQEKENRTGVGKEKSKTDDLDCIQGLLSLSQGAWQ